MTGIRDSVQENRYVAVCATERETERERDRDRQTDRQLETETKTEREFTFFGNTGTGKIRTK